MQEKLEGVKLIIAGRMADPKVIEEARPVMEMKGIKHYRWRGL